MAIADKPCSECGKHGCHDRDHQRLCVLRVAGQAPPYMAFIAASGPWNGSFRVLYWCELLPGFDGWGPFSQSIRIYPSLAKAGEDLRRACLRMENQSLRVDVHYMSMLEELARKAG